MIRTIALAAGAAFLLVSVRPALADTTVVALVASNAADAFRDVAAEYEKAHPGVHVQISAAGSKVIVAQLEQGAAADVIVVSSSFADGSKNVDAPVKLFANHTVISAAKNGKVKSARDLANAGVRVGSGTTGSVAAQISDETLTKLAGAYGADFPAKVKANITLTKTALEQIQKAVDDGVVDAAILFAADADTGRSNVIDLGDKSVTVPYSGAVVKNAKNGAQARDLLAMLGSSEGQAILKKRHHDLLK